MFKKKQSDIPVDYDRGSMTKQKIFNCRTYVLFLTFLLILQLIFLHPLTAFASTENVDITTSSVRDDLASMGEDKLVYLSETTNIFIGMAQRYDPSNKLRTYVYLNYIGSTSDSLKISISTSTKDDKDNITESHADYELSYVNNDSTWVKYEVKGLPNLDFTTRRYNISAISNDTTRLLSMNETYIFHGLSNDSIEVLKQEVETITITEKEVQFFCYGEESQWYDFFGVDGLLGHNKKYTDAWYIFFNTDKPMDDLLEIEITYMPYDYHIQFMTPCQMNYAITDEVLQERIDRKLDFNEETTRTYGEQTVVTITPGTTKVSATTNWWGGYETAYQELDNIMDLRKYDSQATEDNPFVFDEEADKYTWGVNFLNTEKTSRIKGVSVMGVPVDSNIVDGTGVCNTAILRLKYETNGVVRNAYAIDVPTDDFTGNDAQVDLTTTEDIFDRIIAIVMLILLIVVITNVGMPVLTYLIKFLSKIFEVVIRIIFWLLGLPFQIIAWFFY